ADLALDDQHEGTAIPRDRVGNRSPTSFDPAARFRQAIQFRVIGRAKTLASVHLHPEIGLSVTVDRTIELLHCLREPADSGLVLSPDGRYRAREHLISRIGFALDVLEQCVGFGTPVGMTECQSA